MGIVVGILFILFIVVCFRNGWEQQKSYSSINKMARMMKEENERKNKGDK
jgi:hypothetical protein